MNKYKKILLFLFILLSLICPNKNNIYAEEIDNQQIDNKEEESINNNTENYTNDNNNYPEPNIIIDNILEEKEINETNDINKDKVLNINDVTNAIYIKETGKYQNEDELTDNLTGELSNDKDNTYVDDEINIDFSIKGFNNNKVNGLEGELEYNKDKLIFLGVDDKNINIKYGGINTKDKFIYILDDYNQTEKLLSFKFKAINTGIGVVSINNLIISSNGSDLIQNNNNNNISLSMMINNYPKESNNYKENNIKSQVIVLNNKRVSNKPINNTYPVYAISDTGKKISISNIKLSNDNYIKSLIIKNYKINFSKDKLEYNIKTKKNIDKLDIKVILNDDKSSYEIIGNKDFKVGDNKVYIAVTAEDGSIRNYIINVKREKKDNYESNSSRNVIIILLILIVIGLIYIIFKEDEEEKEEN